MNCCVIIPSFWFSNLTHASKLVGDAGYKGCMQTNMAGMQAHYAHRSHIPSAAEHVSKGQQQQQQQQQQHSLKFFP